MSRPAFAFRAGIFLLALAASGPSAAQDRADAATDAAIACLDVEDASARLDCLESAAREIKATRIIRESAAESAAADAAAPVIAADDASAEDLFGAETLASTKKAVREENETARLTAKVVEFRVNSVGDITAVLENGQVWRQLPGDSAVIRIPKSDKVFSVKIKRGPLGNYNMTINELKRTIRVRRIK